VRVVVADTGPLHYLVLIGHSGVLLALFGKVILPRAVQSELMHPEAPPLVRNWISQPPAWVEVREVPGSHFDETSAEKLDEGEKAAIDLAAALGADLLLMDDRKGVMFARKKGFAVTGTLGVLELAAERRLLNLADAFLRLKDTSFHCRQEIMDGMLARYESKT
jgi:predicted nucleic acid-binding protein